MRVFFNAIFVHIFLSTYVLWRGWNALPPNKFVRIPFVFFFAIELIIYFIGYFFFRHLPFDALHGFAWIGTTWMIFIIYMAALLLFYDAVRFINSKKKFMPDSLSPKRYGLRRIYFVSSLIFVIGVMAWGNWCFHHPVVTRLDLKVAKHSPKVKNMRIVTATDIHAGFLINKDIVRKYVDLIMEQKPDMILLVGDIIDYDVRSVEMENMQDEFRRLTAPYGVYATTGNHEYIELKNEPKEAKINWLATETGFTMLRDTAVMVDSTLYIVGREDDKCGHRKELADIMQNVDKHYPVIVMNHEPHRLQEEVDAGADIALYGHTHNGQFFPANLILKFMYELPFGYKKKGDTHIYVSSGLGLAGPQYRIGTISEIVVMDVTFE